MKSYKIERFLSEPDDTHFITKFGGQPDWITTPQWPVSPAWSNRQLKFIGQIRLQDVYPELDSLTLAYIFMTQPDDIDDDFFDPDIIYPDEGENAIIIQPSGTIPEYLRIEDKRTGPSVDLINIWIPKTVEIEETLSTGFEEIDIDKFCGIPALLQASEVRIEYDFLLQLHPNWLPFYVNVGGSPTMFIFLNKEKNSGCIIIEDM